MEKRAYGNTGKKLSIVGFGGLIVSLVEQSEANNYVAEAIDNGINYFDVAPTYYDAQDRLGPALEAYRKDVFLACKTVERSGESAERQMHESLKKLKTDYFDLYQFHGLTTLEDVEKIFAADGAMEVFQKAKKEGLLRYIGFSVHTEEAALAMFDRFDFDSVLFPVNWVAMLKTGFGTKIIDKAVEKRAARLALKGMAKKHWPEDMGGEERKYPKCWYQPIDEEELAGLAFRFTLSQPITSAVSPGDMRLFRMAVKIAESFTPVTADEIEELRRLAMDIKPIFTIYFRLCYYFKGGSVGNG